MVRALAAGVKSSVALPSRVIVVKKVSVDEYPLVTVAVVAQPNAVLMDVPKYLV